MSTLAGTILLAATVFFSVLLEEALASDPDPIQDFCIPDPRSAPIKATHLGIYPCKNASAVTSDDFVFSGIMTEGNFSDTGVAAVPINPIHFPALNTLGMSFVRADLEMNGVNPPHLHPRATEIAYVVKGKVYSGFVDSTDRIFSKVIGAGEVMVYPRGLVHFQMNVGKTKATVFGCFDSQNPGSQKVASAVFGSGIKEELLERAFGLNHREIGHMRRKFAPKGKTERAH